MTFSILMAEGVASMWDVGLPMGTAREEKVMNSTSPNPPWEALHRLRLGQQIWWRDTYKSDLNLEWEIFWKISSRTGFGFWYLVLSLTWESLQAACLGEKRKKKKLPSKYWRYVCCRFYELCLTMYLEKKFWTSIFWLGIWLPHGTHSLWLILAKIWGFLGQM